MNRAPRLFLVRHGQTTSNTIHALDTALPGADLTPLGRQQATEAGEALASRTRRLKVVSSQAARAQQTAVNLAVAFARAGGQLVPAGGSSSFFSDGTAAHLAEQALSGAHERPGAADSPPHSPSAPALPTPRELLDTLGMIPGVAEIAAGDMEMRNDEDAHQAYLGILGGWLHGQRDDRVPGGHTAWEVLGQYVPQLLGLLGEAGGAGAAGAGENSAAAGEPYDIALVSHGAVIRLVAQFLGNVDPDWALAAYLKNAQAVELDPAGAMDLLGDSEPSLGAAISPEGAVLTPEDVEQWENSMKVVSWADHGTPEPRS
ncbi:MAG TPA: phosphoglycerate mutase family protein [Candidatus Corynebacterium gallistercoris]|uniref:Phosphoglycerate mutase family protein n=1 Tax=Candidatus Corynebacterium gallistercoris TaxID=2838530 RepID=A0A9D1RZC3_9CORY|nr:phosphoglycerate mutase family protein [Candidatus Corynebacterium gallistercoris]